MITFMTERRAVKRKFIGNAKTYFLRKPAGLMILIVAIFLAEALI